jgi:hypothetical protein
LSAAHLDLRNTDFDTGQPTGRGGYALADDTYDQLLERLADRAFANVSETLRSNLVSYYGDVDSLPAGTDAERRRSAKVRQQLAGHHEQGRSGVRARRNFNRPGQPGATAARDSRVPSAESSRARANEMEVTMLKTYRWLPTTLLALNVWIATPGCAARISFGRGEYGQNVQRRAFDEGHRQGSIGGRRRTA